MKLKSCPFCGGKAKLESCFSDDKNDLYCVDHKSKKCPIGNEYYKGMETGYYKTKRGAINAWNRRVK